MIHAQGLSEFTDPTLQRRSTGQPFETIAVVWTSASKRGVRGVAWNADVSRLGMAAAVENPSVDDNPGSDAGPDREVNEVLQSTRSAEFALGQRCCIYVRIDCHGFVERGAKLSGDIDVRPARLWRRGDKSKSG